MKALPLIALAAIMMIVGCGQKEETTITTPDGTTVKTSNDGKDVSVSTTAGDVTATLGGVSEAELGLPFYPDSVEDAAGASSKSTVNGKETVVSMRTTKDDPSKVVDFYKDKVKNAKPTTADAGGMKSGAVAGETEDGKTVAIGITKMGTDDTKVVVTVTAK